MNIELDEPTRGPLDELIAATEHKRNLEAQLKAVKKFIDDVKPVVLEKFRQEGTQSVNKDGNTAYIRKDFTVKPVVSKEHVIAMLEKTGLHDLINQTYNYRRLCAFVKECEERGEDLPLELLESIETDEKYDIIVRKS